MTWLRRALAATRGEFDAQTVVLLGGLGLVGYGAWLLLPAAGFIAPGAVLVWWTLPTRPPFVVRPREKS
jgi:hypothetical protein